MKIRCQTRVLQEAVGTVGSVIGSNPTRPILLSVLLQADEDLRVVATDLDVALSVRVDEVDIEEKGTLAIPAARLHSILRELQEEETLITLDSGKVEIRSGSAFFRVAAEPAEEFPTLDFQPPAAALRTPREPFVRALGQVAIAAARDATRFQMHSVLLDCAEDRLRMVSTDGKRMAIGSREISVEGGDASTLSQHIVPLKGVELLTRILASEESEEIELHLDAKRLTYNSDRVSLSTSLVEGRYPPYERAIPEDLEILVEFSSDRLLSALRQAALMTTKESHTVRFHFEDNTLTLLTNTSNVGESRVEMGVTITGADGRPFDISFNPHYLMELIKVAESPEIQGRFRDAKTAGCFSIKGDEEAYRHIVMPLVTSD